MCIQQKCACIVLWIYFVRYVPIRKEVSLTENQTQTDNPTLFGKAAHSLWFTCSEEKPSLKNATV